MRKRQRKKNVDKWQRRAQWEIDKRVRNGMTSIHFTWTQEAVGASVEQLAHEIHQIMKAIKHAVPYEEFA